MGVKVFDLPVKLLYSIALKVHLIEEDEGYVLTFAPMFKEVQLKDLENGDMAMSAIAHSAHEGTDHTKIYFKENDILYYFSGDEEVKRLDVQLFGYMVTEEHSSLKDAFEAAML